MAKNYDFTFFSPKYAWLPSYVETLQSYSLYPDRLTPIKSFQQYLLLPEKYENKNAAFLNVLVYMNYIYMVEVFWTS